MTTPTDPLYATQWHFGLIGNIERIWDEYTGDGVAVGVYDDGIDLTHEDLAANYDASRHVLDNFGNPIIPAHDLNGAHGTATAGLIGAASNGVGGVGVAWGVSLTAVNIFNPALYGYVNAAVPTGFYSVVHQAAGLFDISSNSWGASPVFVNGLASAGFAQSLEVEYNFLSQFGRSGLGTIIVQAAGNNNLDANGDGVNASRFTITVAATESDGFAASYSNFGASILVTAPAAAVTTDRTGADGYDPSNYTTTFNGTSAATPVVSGVVALMLQANSGLGWRDVQDILAMSATLTGSAFNASTGSGTEDGLWQSNHSGIWNGGGNHIHTNYGYGMVNAYNAVRMAEVWNLFDAAETSANETVTSVTNDFPDVALPDNNATGLDFTFTVATDLSIDHVALRLDLSTTFIGDLRITLTSAAGTVITLAKGGTGLGTDVNGVWVWGLDQLRGELSAGTWTLHVADILGGDIATLRSATLDVYGSAANVNNTYHFTDEFLTMAGFEAGRSTISDTNGGTDWLNLAAVQGDVSMDMASGATFTVDSVNWAALSGDFENVVTGDGNDTIIGNDLDNIIHGMRGDDVIHGGINAVNGGAGDTMYGGAGNDTLGGGFNKDDAYGGAGNDTFAQEAGSYADNVYGGDGIDTLDLSAEAAEAYVVNLTTQNYQFVANPYGANGTYDLIGVEIVIGSTLNDSITGNAIANVLSGGSGNDSIIGGGGFDTLAGGAGNDLLYVDSALDVIVEEVGQGTLDRVFSAVSFTLAGDDNIEYLATTSALGTTSINLTGNTLAQQILGNAGANQLFGGDGNDTITGNAGNDSLTGGVGADSLIGGADNDWYFVDVSGDVIVETAGGGTLDRVLSSVSYLLGAAADIEYLATTSGAGVSAINLTGNALSQIIIGNAGVNHLFGGDGNDTITGNAGNDSLTGGLGVDSLIGGADSDWYFIDNAGDITIETAGGGTLDRALTSVSYTLAAAADIEYLATASAAGLGAINLGGNALSQSIIGNAGINVLNGGAGNDTITGNAGNDSLNGGTGNDSLIGGADNDWYYVDSQTDIVVEVAGGGTVDRVLTSANYALSASADIEYLATTAGGGFGAINLAGNSVSQTIIGNAGINIINGGAGSDTVTGGAGADQFVFNSALGATNIDKITDYTVADDQFVLENGIFTGIPLVGLLPLLAFEANLTGVSTLGTSRIVYETDTGKLFYDIDGVGGAAGVQFALITANLLGMNGNEFQII